MEWHAIVPTYLTMPVHDAGTLREDARCLLLADSGEGKAMQRWHTEAGHRWCVPVQRCVCCTEKRGSVRVCRSSARAKAPPARCCPKVSDDSHLFTPFSAQARSMCTSSPSSVPLQVLLKLSSFGCSTNVPAEPNCCLGQLVCTSERCLYEAGPAITFYSVSFT